MSQQVPVCWVLVSQCVLSSFRWVRSFPCAVVNCLFLFFSQFLATYISYSCCCSFSSVLDGSSSDRLASLKKRLHAPNPDEGFAVWRELNSFARRRRRRRFAGVPINECVPGAPSVPRCTGSAWLHCHTRACHWPFRAVSAPNVGLTYHVVPQLLLDCTGVRRFATAEVCRKDSVAGTAGAWQ